MSRLYSLERTQNRLSTIRFSHRVRTPSSSQVWGGKFCFSAKRSQAMPAGPFGRSSERKRLPWGGASVNKRIMRKREDHCKECRPWYKAPSVSSAMSLGLQLTALMSRILFAISSAVVKSWIKKCYGGGQE
ncbi:hypothetical protein BC937DRAFT_86350 [Endogone sp. FLAS-F59071]|nr:hypothetical protein BC937DRAFT_86350 [Endogone sp. FLAS-F59071]|eukprot:RUS13102.1 hypothetical protein BC937DRAFT_86350 [Endogone sp. FLAS-F59071]